MFDVEQRCQLNAEPCMDALQMVAEGSSPVQPAEIPAAE